MWLVYSLYVFFCYFSTHVGTRLFKFLITQHYLCELTFARMIKFIIFRIACPALITEHTNTSHWHLDGAELHNDTLMNYDANAPLRCDIGYWLHPWSTSGNPNTTQTLKCGINGTWTPAADCSLISMQFWENCLTSLPVIKYLTDVQSLYML